MLWKCMLMSATFLETVICCYPMATMNVSYSICNINLMLGSDEEIRKTVNIVFQKYDQNNNGYMEYPEIAAYLNDALRSEEGRDATED